MSLGCIHSWTGVHRAIRGLVLAAALVGCAKGGSASSNEYLGDGSFGGPGDPLPEEAGVESDASTDDTDSGLSGERVRMRVFHGVPNLPGARFCYDPDYTVDDPTTDADETANGPIAPQWLPFGDGGVVSFADTSDYVTLPAMTTGAITVHRALMPPPPSDASVAISDAQAAFDASLDGGLDAGMEGGNTPDAAAFDAGGPCDLGSLETVLPLPLTAAWLMPDHDKDAATVEPEKRGFVVTASAGDTLTLFGAGLALDMAELMRRAEMTRQAQLATNPGDSAGAAAEARHQVLSLQSTYGDRFLLSRGPTPDADHFSLALAHLIPDVPASLAGKPTIVGSGALRLCVTIDKKDSDPADGGVSRFEFRDVTGIANNLDPSLSYRFRVFVDAEYQNGPNSCATTSLKPVARLDVDAGTFAADRSYTLMTWGTYDPVSACTSANASALIKQGCARAADALGARIDIVPNELPQP